MQAPQRVLALVLTAILGCRDAEPREASPKGPAPTDSTEPAAATDPPGKPTTRTSALTHSCEQCHQFAACRSHPVGVASVRLIPADLPLDDGRVVCTTCHEEVEHAARVNGPMLRASAVCEACHAPGSPAHTATRLHAHTGDGVGDSLTAEGLNGESAACLTCHDGATACGADPWSASGEDLQRTHAGRRFRQESSESGRGGLVAPSELDPRLRLCGDRIECTTCHSPYARAPGLLVIPGPRTMICRGCHVR